MIRRLKKGFFVVFSRIDAMLKFPELKPGETAIQAGFDMSSPLTSDLFEMAYRVGKAGKVIGIDPDPYNHQIAEKIIRAKHIRHVTLIKKAVFNKQGKTELVLGSKPSWNQVLDVPIDATAPLKKDKIKVPLDTIDHIIKAAGVEISDIGHINLTINGSEYYALKGMDKILKHANDLSLTVIAGRHDESGTIESQPDYIKIIPLLESYGFKTRFYRIHQLIWWGFVVKFLINRKSPYFKKNYGIIFAAKGKKKIRYYQSFS